MITPGEGLLQYAWLGKELGVVFNMKTVFPGIGIPIRKI